MLTRCGGLPDEVFFFLFDRVLEQFEDGGHELGWTALRDACQREIAVASDDEVHLPGRFELAGDELFHVGLSMEVHLYGGEVHVLTCGAYDSPTVVGRVCVGKETLQLL